MADANWYVVHTYSGYENKVKANIEKTIENRKLQDQILEVSVPLETAYEIKNGVKKQVQKKMFPGYVLINMIKCDPPLYHVKSIIVNQNSDRKILSKDYYSTVARKSQQ